MKNIKIIKVFALVALCLAFSCESIVNEIDLVNSTDLESVQVVAEQNPAGSNVITLKMITPGVSGSWDYGVGIAFTDRVSFNTPIGGKQTFTYSGNLGAEYFTKDVEVTVDNFVSGSIPEDYFDLAGDNPNLGKTWVFNGSAFDGTDWWYMCQNDRPDLWAGVWWNAGGTCCPPNDVNGTMHFDLDGSANYTYMNGGNEVKGGFSLNAENNSLSITGGINILGAEAPRGRADGVYTIISLTKDELILYNPKTDEGTGWVWKFKPL